MPRWPRVLVPWVLVAAPSVSTAGPSVRAHFEASEWLGPGTIPYGGNSHGLEDVVRITIGARHDVFSGRGDWMLGAVAEGYMRADELGQSLLGTVGAGVEGRYGGLIQGQWRWAVRAAVVAAAGDRAAVNASVGVRFRRDPLVLGVDVLGSTGARAPVEPNVGGAGAALLFGIGLDGKAGGIAAAIAAGAIAVVAIVVVAVFSSGSGF